MTDFNPDLADRLRRACEQRIAAQIAQAARRRAERAALRAEFARRRSAGLVARQRRKTLPTGNTPKTEGS